MRTKVILVMLTIAAVTVACSRPAGTQTGPADVDSQDASPQGGATSKVLAPPGLYDQADGTVQALGILTFRDSEGGFWAVVNTAIAEEADTATVIAVIKPDNDIAGSMESNRGSFVSIIGTRDDDRTYQAGPLIEGRSIEKISDTAVK